jgi:hypothetical protein
MKHVLATWLECLAIMLTPGVALAFLAFVVYEALPVVPTVIDSLTTAPEWAQGYLVGATGFLLVAAGMALLTTARWEPSNSLETVLPRGGTEHTS